MIYYNTGREQNILDGMPLEPDNANQNHALNQNQAFVEGVFNYWDEVEEERNLVYIENIEDRGRPPKKNEVIAEKTVPDLINSNSFFSFKYFFIVLLFLLLVVLFLRR